MPSSVIDLRPNQGLLDHEFEGYKLNLQALPHYSYKLDLSIDALHPDESQYSFIHAKLFALHNHLVSDNWDHTFSFYYIDKKLQIRRIVYDNIYHSFQSRVVYNVPKLIERKSGHYNLSLSFPSYNLGLVADGTGYLHIVNTMDRNNLQERNQMWQTVHSSLVLGEGNFFIIIDSRMQEVNNDLKILHCLLQSVEQNAQHFNSVLTWITLEYRDQTWKQCSIRQLQGKGIIHYAAFETTCNALYVASDNVFKFTHDSENEITESPKQESKSVIYTWLQTSEDITVNMKLGSKFDRNLLYLNITPQNITVSYSGKKYIDGKLQYKVDSELTTWNVQSDGQIDILMTKSDSMIWNELIDGGDCNGEQILDPTLVEEAHKRLAHLCSETEVKSDQIVPAFSTQEIEECDAISEEDTVLVRIAASTHEITHRISLSVHQYLFNKKIENQEAPALIIRHDVDGCCWQPYAQLPNSDTWPLKHQGTLMAFGYIQSSKQNRKFLTCSPDLRYSVVCEASRHLFIYRSSGNEDCQLRKRHKSFMKNVNVGQQFVFNIDKYGEVLGINATNELLFVLTKSKLIVLEV